MKVTALLYRFLTILFIFVDLQTNNSFWSYHSEGYMLLYVSSESRVYRIAGIFRGFRRLNMYREHLSPLQKGCYSTKITKGISVRIYTLEIYPLYGTCIICSHKPCTKALAIF